jgi:hypothetical protein
MPLLLPTGWCKWVGGWVKGGEGKGGTYQVSGVRAKDVSGQV